MSCNSVCSCRSKVNLCGTGHGASFRGKMRPGHRLEMVLVTKRPPLNYAKRLWFRVKCRSGSIIIAVGQVRIALWTQLGPCRDELYPTMSHRESLIDRHQKAVRGVLVARKSTDPSFTIKFCSLSKTAKLSQCTWRPRGRVSRNGSCAVLGARAALHVGREILFYYGPGNHQSRP